MSGALGAPVRDVSETLSEYRVSDTPGKIYVQYRKGSTTIERIEVLPATRVGRSEILRLLELPDAASSSKANAKGRLEEYFDLSDNGVQGVGEYRLGAPSGGSANGTWKESFRDNDKTAQRSGIVRLTLVGGKTLQIEITEDEPILTWNGGGELYPSRMRKGARWSETLTKAE